jgi:putative transposase
MYMPRNARIVAPGFAHHVTQRGTDHQKVFFSIRDRQVYLDLLAQQTRLGHIRVLAYCLMSNHLHLVVVPDDGAALAESLQRVHGRYAQYLNARRLRSGHLWQNRFFSCPLDEAHLWAAIRYVERNPVRAHITTQAWEYHWSSAEAHITGRDGAGVLDMGFWQNAGRAGSWREVLAVEEDEPQRRTLRRATYSGKPLGDEEFTTTWGRKAAAKAVAA